MFVQTLYLEDYFRKPGTIIDSPSDGDWVDGLVGVGVVNTSEK